MDGKQILRSLEFLHLNAFWYKIDDLRFKRIIWIIFEKDHRRKKKSSLPSMAVNNSWLRGTVCTIMLLPMQTSNYGTLHNMPVDVLVFEYETRRSLVIKVLLVCNYVPGSSGRLYTYHCVRSV